MVKLEKKFVLGFVFLFALSIFSLSFVSPDQVSIGCCDGGVCSEVVTDNAYSVCAERELSPCTGLGQSCMPGGGGAGQQQSFCTEFFDSGNDPFIPGSYYTFNATSSQTTTGYDTCNQDGTLDEYYCSGDHILKAIYNPTNLAKCIGGKLACDTNSHYDPSLEEGYCACDDGSFFDGTSCVCKEGYTFDGTSCIYDLDPDPSPESCGDYSHSAYYFCAGNYGVNTSNIVGGYCSDLDGKVFQTNCEGTPESECIADCEWHDTYEYPVKCVGLSESDCESILYCYPQNHCECDYGYSLQGSPGAESCQENICLDTDSGIDKFTSGTVTFNGVDYPDSCIDGYYLNESYCGSESQYVGSEILCGAGCVNGACNLGTLDMNWTDSNFNNISFATSGQQVYAIAKGEGLSSISLVNINYSNNNPYLSGLTTEYYSNSKSLSLTYSFPTSMEGQRFFFEVQGINQRSPNLYILNPFPKWMDEAEFQDLTVSGANPIFPYPIKAVIKEFEGTSGTFTIYEADNATEDDGQNDTVGTVSGVQSTSNPTYPQLVGTFLINQTVLDASGTEDDGVYEFYFTYGSYTSPIFKFSFGQSGVGDQCSDRIKNGNELYIDCGGPDCPDCCGDDVCFSSEPLYEDLESCPVDCTAPCLGINVCSDYKTSGACQLDSCNAAANTGYSGDVECSWDTGLSVCNAKSVYSVGNQLIGSCEYIEDTSQDTCDDGFLSYSWDAIWTWDASNSGMDQTACENEWGEGSCVEDGSSWYYDPEGYFSQCLPGSNTVPCPAQVQLSFFSWQNGVALIVLLGLIYWFMQSRKLKKKVVKKRVNSEKKSKRKKVSRKN